MRAINHALTGAVIGLTVPNPAVAAVAAVASHFVLDVIPHYGTGKRDEIRSRSFGWLLVVDAILCFILVLLLAGFAGSNWWVAALCAFLAAAPDFASVNRYKHAVRRTYWEPGWFTKFATTIQWFERPLGAIVEAVWFIAAIGVLVVLL